MTTPKYLMACVFCKDKRIACCAVQGTSGPVSYNVKQKVELKGCLLRRK